MQNRGALWVFTILLAIACLWQISFSFFSGRFEAKAVDAATAQADSVIAIPGNDALDHDSVRLVFENKYLRDHSGEQAYPLFGYSYKECKEKEMSMGLDLKGGMAVTLEVSIPELVDNLSGDNQDPAFRSALAAARQRQLSDNKDFITLFDEEFRKAAPNGSLAAIFSTQDNAAMFPRESTNDQVIGILRDQARAALDNTEKIMRNRIDKFGVAQPILQKQALSGRIQIELPGVKDKDRVRRVLQSTANLEFWETWDNSQVYMKLSESNDKLAAMLAPEGESVLVEAFDHTLSTGVQISGSGNGVEKSLVEHLKAGAGADKDTWYDFDRVTFESGSARLDEAGSDVQLTNLVEVMKAYPDLRLKIGGYTDSTGNEAANQRLSQERAQAVVAALVRKGVAADRLEAEGYGSLHPVATNTTEEGRAKNRRMALRVLAVGAAANADADSLADALADTDTTQADTGDTEISRAESLKRSPLINGGRLELNLMNSGQGLQVVPGDVVGYAAVTDTAEVNRLLRLAPPASPDPSQGLRLAWSSKPTAMTTADGSSRDMLSLHALRAPRNGKPKLDGSVIVDARQDYDIKGDAEVAMQMNSEGARIWKLMTGENVGKQIAIVLDGNVVSAPNVLGEIPGGRSSISMGGGDRNAQLEEAVDLANVLKAGALPAPARIIDETVVGPTLGAENIDKGIFSFIISLIGVLLVMWLYYNRAGWIADLALLANVFFLIGTMASLQAVLTLPGMAGIVLTIGMAVDANVLINERVRDELKHGRALKSAVDTAYSNEGALSAILDSNITTFITAVILYIFGSGPIRGFATTLGLGILTSMFTAIFLSRMLMTARLEKGRSISFWRDWNKNLFDGARFDFMGKRKLFYGVSIVLVGLSLASMFTRGFNLGVDFTGGRTYVVQFDQPVDVEDTRAKLEPMFVGDDGKEYSVGVKTYGSSSRLKVTTGYLIDDASIGTDERVEARLHEALGQMGNKYVLEESRKVDPTISDDIQTKAWTSVLVALVFMFIYIAVRFNNVHYGIGALVSLAHDTIIVLGLYSMLWGILPISLEIDEAFIGVILTVVGYSLNDTVVVFDRIREYLRDHKREDTVTVFNKALNSTLSRTLNTGFCTLLVLAVIYFLGGVSIKGFVFGIFFGTVVGTYSSIFTGSAVAVDLILRKERQTRTENKAVTA